ncbi:hypothetical protein REPUB_Repub20aG0082300 [Reevesia pubescens]
MEAVDQRVDDGSPTIENDRDFDDIDNMRIRGSKNKDDRKESEKKESVKKKDDPKESKRIKKSNIKQLEVVENRNVSNILDKFERALNDDLHDVIYTPRKGDRLEGKLQIVLQSIIDNGVNVKVKLNQRRPKKAAQASLA